MATQGLKLYRVIIQG